MWTVNWILVLLNRLCHSASIWLYFDISTLFTVLLQGLSVLMSVHLCVHMVNDKPGFRHIKFVFPRAATAKTDCERWQRNFLAVSWWSYFDHNWNFCRRPVHIKASKLSTVVSLLVWIGYIKNKKSCWNVPAKTTSYISTVISSD